MRDFSSIMMSSRIRLARSLGNHVFPSKLSRAEGNSIISEVVDVINGLGGDYKVYTMEQLPALDAEVMQEKHLISKNLLENTDSGAVVLSEDETISVMINEEDHIREQCFLKGFKLDQAYEAISKIDDALLAKLDIAYDSRLGFLNSCITNVGTGMRASVMMFLPGLSLSGQIESIVENLRMKGLTVRGVFGEGSDASGYIYQVSNARSLGVTERDIINRVMSTCINLCESELDARSELLKTNEIALKDRIFRAYGILTNAYSISAKEFMKCAGDLKIGVAMGIIKFNDRALIDKLIFDALPSTLTKISGNEALLEDDENMIRAKFVANTLKKSRVL